MQELKQLTSKQENFAQCVADGMSQADAYRAAYDVGASTKKETIHRKAAAVAAMGQVAARIEELKQLLSNKSIWTREMSVKALADIAADTVNKGSEKVAAIKELNAMHGYNAPEKIQISGNITTQVIKWKDD